MGVWGWHSPIAWAIFLVSCGVTVVLLAWAISMLGNIPLPTSLTQDNKKK